MNIDDCVGSLSVGKHADLVVWSSHPFDYHARAEIIVVDGELDILK